MTREMVNMAKVNTHEIAEETGICTEAVEKVVRQIVVDKNNHKRQPKPPTPEGGISLRAAGRKYGVPSGTLSRWAQKGYIPILLRTKNELYLDESKLARLIKLYRHNPGQGKRTLKQNLNNS